MVRNVRVDVVGEGLVKLQVRVIALTKQMTIFPIFTLPYNIDLLSGDFNRMKRLEIEIWI